MQDCLGRWGLVWGGGGAGGKGGAVLGRSLLRWGVSRWEGEGGRETDWSG